MYVDLLGVSQVPWTLFTLFLSIPQTQFLLSYLLFLIFLLPVQTCLSIHLMDFYFGYCTLVPEFLFGFFFGFYLSTDVSILLAHHFSTSPLRSLSIFKTVILKSLSRISAIRSL